MSSSPTDSPLTGSVWHLDGQGGGQRLVWRGGQAYPKAQPLLWIHLAYTDPEVRTWLSASELLETPLIDALLDEETRPRVLHHGDGLLLTLRGVNLNPGADPEDMVSIRLWIDKERIISTRKRRLKSVAEIETLLEKALGPRSTGEFLVLLLGRLTDNIGDVIEDLQERMADVEEKIIDQAETGARQSLSELRRQAVALRRYLAPQREALARLSVETVPWISADEHFRIREIADELIRHIEDLDAVRERAVLANEEVSNRLSEELNQRMFLLSVVTVVFLPLGFLTGLFGINVGGIPGADSPQGFITFCLVLSAVVVCILFLFKRNRWL